MRRLTAALLTVLALASVVNAASLSDDNMIAIVKNIAKRCSLAMVTADTTKAYAKAQVARLVAITDAEGNAASILQGVLRDSVNLTGKALARLAVEREMRAFNAIFRDPNLTPKGSDGSTTYSNFEAYMDGQFEADDRLPYEFALVWRIIFGNGSLGPEHCQPKPMTTMSTVTCTVGTDSITDMPAATPISTDLYAGGTLEAYVTTKMGMEDTGDTVTFTVRGTDINGSVWQGTFPLGDSATVGTTVAVTPSIANTYPVVLTNVTADDTVTAGVFTIRTKADAGYSR